MKKNEIKKMTKTERAIFGFLKADFDDNLPEKRTRFTVNEIAKALKLDDAEVTQTLNNLIKSNGHIFFYGDRKNELFRYRSKTRQEVQQTIDAITASWCS